MKYYQIFCLLKQISVNAKDRLRNPVSIHEPVLKISHFGIHMVFFKEQYSTSPKITAHAHGTFLLVVILNICNILLMQY